MGRCFPQVLKGYTSKQKRKNLAVFSQLSVKINSTACFIFSVGPGNGGGGVYDMAFGPNGGGGGSLITNSSLLLE